MLRRVLDVTSARNPNLFLARERIRRRLPLLGTAERRGGVWLLSRISSFTGGIKAPNREGGTGVDWWPGLGCLKLNDQGATDAPAEPPELSHYLIKLTTRSPLEHKQSVNARAARGKHPRRRSATAGLAGPRAFTFFEASVLGKMLEILQQIAPGTSRVAVIYNPDNAANAYALRLTGEFARSLGIDPILAPFQRIAELEHALEPMAKRGNGAIFSIPDLTVYQMRAQITELAARLRLPAIYSDRIMMTSGGLASYDADRIDIYRRAASYVDRVLRGEKVGDLPFQQPTKYQLMINLKTAKALGLDVPPTLLARADEVIE